MWIFTNNSFVSIVEHRDDPDTLLVRGRFKGDAARFLGLKAFHEIETPTADYRFRVLTSRAQVEKAIARNLAAANYPNFKDSIATKWRKAVAMRVWSILHAEQQQRHGRGEGAHL